MAVYLSPVGGVAAQFFDNNGTPLAGGLIYTYAAGTSTPATTYTSSSGIIAHSNPIVLDASGRVPTGEIWLSDVLAYKFVIKTAQDVLIASYDNISGINSNFVAYTAQQEIQTATAGQTLFTLTTMTYQPGTNNLAVYVDGVNQYGPGAQYAYVETSSTEVTFVSGLHVGASVKFTTATPVASAIANAENVAYDPPFFGAVTETVEAKLAQIVSVKDFGAVGDGVTDDTAAIQDADLAVNTDGGGTLTFPNGTYDYTFFTPSYNVRYEFYGPDVSGNSIGADSSWVSQNPSLVYLSGNHTGKQKVHKYVRTVAEGSGVLGPTNADFGIVVDIEKENWTSASAEVGEIDAMYIRVNNGTNTSSATPRSDCASILSNVKAMDGTGFSAFVEAQNDLIDRGTSLATLSTNVQILPINGLIDAYAARKYSYGIVFNAKAGASDAAILVQDESGATWTNIIESRTTNGTNYLTQDVATTDLIVKNKETGNQLVRIHRELLKIVNTSTYTIDPILDLQNQINFTTACTVTLPATAQNGFSVKCFQGSSGKVTFTAAAGASVINVDGQYRTRGGSSMVTLTVNGGGGSSAIWYLNGDTSV